MKFIKYLNSSWYMEILLASIGQWGYVVTLCIGLLGGFMGAIAGGRGLICITLLLIFGVPVDIAIASSKVGSLGYTTGALKKFLKSGYVLWKYILPLSIGAVAGGYIGSNLLVEMNTDILIPAIGVILLLLLPFLFIYKDFGEVHMPTSGWKKYLGYGLYFLVAIYGGFFGGGVGMLITYICIFCFGFTILHIKATSMLPRFLLNCTAVYVFFQHGLIDMRLAGILFVGMMIGGYVGAHVAIKKGNRWLKMILALFIVVSVIKLLWPYLF